MTQFSSFGLSDPMLTTLTAKGFTQPTPVQTLAIPAILKGTADIVVQAQTGTGKTAAIAIPIIELLNQSTKKVQVLILTPTRELAQQVCREVASLAGQKKIKTLAVYGGQSMSVQFHALSRGVDIVVGTPGRVLDHLTRKTLNISAINWLILDEADEMLDMGFAEDMEEIMAHAAPQKRTMLLSATIPPRVMEMAKKFMNDPQLLSPPRSMETENLTEQIYFEVRENDKFEALCRIIDIELEFYGLIFCRTKIETDALSRKLADRRYGVEALHGDIAQHQREKILEQFRKKHIQILVATDVAARGIDIRNLTHVINYSLPQDYDSYIHRIGRTGRAGSKGKAVTFITPAEYRTLLFIQKRTKSPLRKAHVPEVQEVIRTKKARITEEFDAMINMRTEDMFTDWAKKLLTSYEAQDLVAVLLRTYLEDTLDEQNYGEITPTHHHGSYTHASGVDAKGATRLFVSLGYCDGFNPKKLHKHIVSTTGCDAGIIEEIRMFEKFSLITVPFTEAEEMISCFSQKNPNRRVEMRHDSGGSGKPQGKKEKHFRKERKNR